MFNDSITAHNYVHDIKYTHMKKTYSNITNSVYYDK